MSNPEALAGEVVDEAPDNLPATRPLPGSPSSAGAGLTATLARLPADQVALVVAHSAEVARELRRVIDSVKGPDGTPSLVTTFTRKGKTSEHLREGAWSLLGSMVGVGVRVVDQRPVDYSHPVHRPRAVGWESMAEAFDRASGETLAAEWGMCLRSDGDQWSTGAEYALRGMSATRAKVRAMKAVLGHIVSLAGFDPTPAEERDPRGGVEGDGFPEGAKRPTAAQTRKIDERLAKLDLDRGGECPVEGGWRDYLDAFLARRLRGRGIAGLTREEADRALARLDELVEGKAPEPIEPGAPAGTIESAPPPNPAPSGPSSSAEGRVRLAQINREAGKRSIPAEALAALLAADGVRAEHEAEDLAADGERYRRALAAVTAWSGTSERPSTVEKGRSGPDAAPASAGGAESTGSEDRVAQDGAQDPAGEVATPASAAAEASPPADPPAGGNETPPAGGGDEDACPACGEASPGGALCAECRAMGLGS